MYAAITSGMKPFTLCQVCNALVVPLCHRLIAMLLPDHAHHVHMQGYTNARLRHPHPALVPRLLGQLLVANAHDAAVAAAVIHPHHRHRPQNVDYRHACTTPPPPPRQHNPPPEAAWAAACGECPRCSSSRCHRPAPPPPSATCSCAPGGPRQLHPAQRWPAAAAPADGGSGRCWSGGWPARRGG